MKKTLMLIALVAFLGVSVAPVFAIATDATVIEMGKEDPKKAEKAEKKSGCAEATNSGCGETKTAAKSGSACESKGTTAEKSTGCCESTAKPAAKSVASKSGEKK